MNKITAFVGQVPQKFYQKKISKTQLIAVAIITGAIGVYALIHSLAATGTVLFKSDFESGTFTGWYVQSLPGRASILSGTATVPAFQGSKYAHFEVRDGDVEPDTGAERSEISGPTFNEGQDLYIRDAIRIPSSTSFQGPWQIIQQLHETNWNSSPGMALFLDATPSLKLGAGDGSPTYWSSPTLQKNQWYDLVYHVKLSQDSSVGLVEVWLDGAPQKLLNGQTRMYGQTIQAAQTYLKAGIYRAQSSTGTSLIDHDNIIVGTSFDAVSPGTAPPPPSPTPDATAPTVSLTAPANSATVSGSSTTVSANASDDTGVVGVQFKLDGNNLGSEDTTSPYSTTWDTTTATNGTHTLTAIARDAAGNITTSSAVTVTVNNTVTSALLWSGDFETGNLSQWSLNQSCVGPTPPAGVTVVTSPVRSGKYATAFTVADTSTSANCPYVPTATPRAQLVGPALFNPGDDRYIAFSTYFPAGFPATTDWFQIGEIYGPPFGGSPSMGIGLTGNRLTLDRDPTHNWDNIWTASTDIAKGTGWEDLVLHVKFSTDPSVGFVELWRNGVRQTFNDGSQRIYYDTLVPGVNWDGSSPNRLYINQYRSSKTLMGTVTLYHDDARVGTTYASVAGTSTPPPSDTTAPTVSFTSPTNGSTVSGIVTATAGASDNVGVTKVDLSLDGNLKLADTASPYNYSFDSKTLTNGNHTLTAKAYDAAGNTSTSTVTVNVSNPDITAPNAPTGLSAAAANATTVNLAWSASTDTGSNPTGVVKYNVLRNGVVIAQPTATGYTDNNRTANTTYSYTVQAVDGANNTSANSNTATVTTPAVADTTPPTTPTNLTGSAAGANQVNLAWNASTDTGGSGLAGYNVYRNGTKLNSSLVTTTSYGDGTVSGNSTYSYTVQAVDGAGNLSAQTGPVSVTTPAAPDTTPPTAPTNLKVTSLKTNSVSLAWGASTDNVGVTGYQVWRSKTNTSSWAKIGQVQGNILNYTDSTVSRHRTYYYAIRSVDAAGNISVSSNTLQVRTPRR
jgi:fibronectin type 3 domain-containing protein